MIPQFANNFTKSPTVNQDNQPQQLQQQRQDQSSRPDLDSVYSQKPEKKISIFYILSFLLLLSSLGWYGAGHAYNWYLGRQIESLQQQLVDAKDYFNPELIKEIDGFHNNVNALKQIETSRISFNGFFGRFEKVLLSDATIYNISITENDDSYSLTFSGELVSLNDIINQIRAFKSDTLFSSLNVSQVSFSPRDQASNYVFSVSGNIGKDLIKKEATRDAVIPNTIQENTQDPSSPQSAIIIDGNNNEQGSGVVPEQGGVDIDPASFFGQQPAANPAINPAANPAQQQPQQQPQQQQQTTPQNSQPTNPAQQGLPTRQVPGATTPPTPDATTTAPPTNSP
ncbi:MAG: hypothetical protein OXU73_00680 [Candidatus Campbellbacteria bacterium]|nr:hypothetical protein [Candidatus Campbellbacteria bacterium]